MPKNLVNPLLFFAFQNPNPEIFMKCTSQFFKRSTWQLMVFLGLWASAPLGAAETVEFFLGSGSGFVSMGTDTGAPNEAPSGLLAAGSYQIKATFTDSTSAPATSSTNTFTVDGTPPTLAGTAMLSVLPSQSVTSLDPTFTLSANATLNPASGSTKNLTYPVVCRVTAQDGTSFKNDTVSVQSYAAWKHSGSMFILTTPEGANLPASATEKDFPLLVRLNKDNFDFKHVKANGEDIRFSSGDGAPLAYEIEQWDAVNGRAAIWVKIPTITGNARQEIKMYWGNAAAVSESSGPAVFNSTNGYVAVLHMNESVQDATRSVTAKDTGTTVSNGMIGKSRYFPGDKGIVCGEPIKGNPLAETAHPYNQLGNDGITSFPKGVSAHSTQAWFRTSEINRDLVDWGVEGGFNKVQIKIASPPHIYIDGNFASTTGNTKLSQSQWHQVVYTSTPGTPQVARIYVDGQFDASSDVTMKLPIKSKLWVGGWLNRYNFIGDIDEVRVSQTARSADWIKMEYENQKSLQTLVGTLVSSGSIFAVTPASVTMNEGATTTLTGQAGGAQKFSWSRIDNGVETMLAVDQLTFAFTAERVTANLSCKLQFKALYADGVKTKDIAITIKETIPEPIFILKAPTKWDGRSTIEVESKIANLAAMQAANAGDLKVEWSAEPFAIIKEVAPGKLRLLRSQNSGKLTVTATVSNGGKPVTQRVDIMVTEPKSDLWLARTPAKDEKPEAGQFYARDDKGLGMLHYNGMLTDAADAVFLKLYANDKLIKTETAKPAADKSYKLSTQLKPGLIQYKVEFGTKAGGKETVLQTVNDLVCGDAYIIDGQSNALATDTAEKSAPETNKWIRSYGRPSGNKTGDTVNLWCYPVWKAQKGEKAELGWWGMELAKRLVASQKVPIFILNAAVGGTRIDLHQVNPANRRDTSGANAWENPYNLYGTMLTRVEGAKLTHGIRGIIWHQGENDQGSDGPSGGYGWENYQPYFIAMSAAWKQDFPNVQHYFVFQIWPNACSMGGNKGSGDMLREKQRTLPFLYSNMSILSTLGVRPPGGCHYPLEGWAEFARLLQPLIEREINGKVATGPLTAPNLKSAKYANTTQDKIALEFDQPVVWAETLVGEFYVDGEKGKVISGSVAGNVLTLNLKGPASAKTITYIKEIAWSQERLLNGANGIAALTFANVPVATATPVK